MKFKIGDKVRVLDDPSGEWRVIEEVRISWGVAMHWVGDDWHEEDELEPIEDPLAAKIEERNHKPTLNTGDPWIDNLPEEYFEMYEEEELVNHPAHYTQGSMETIEKIKLLLTEEEYRGFLKGNIIKYDDRMNHKGDAENDLRKSKWYAERLQKENTNEKDN